MAENIANDIETTLNGGITNVATSITVTSSSNFPATPFRAVLFDPNVPATREYIRVTNVSGTTWTVTRAVEDATRFPAIAWSSGVTIAHIITAVSLPRAINKANQIYNVRDYGAVGDSVRAYDGDITSGTATLTCTTTAPFLSTDVGKTVWVIGAGVSGAPLITTIAGYTSSSVVTLTATASTTVAAADGMGAIVLVLRTDDTAAFNAALAAMPARLGGVLRIPEGAYNVYGLSLTGHYGMTIEGDGLGSVLIGKATETTLSIITCPRQQIRNVAFAGGDIGLSVNGAHLGQFENIIVEGTTGDGFAVNGDSSSEYAWKDCIASSCGAIGYHYTRTNANDSGGLFLIHVEALKNLGNGTSGIVLEGTVAVGSFLFANHLVADGYSNGPAIRLTNQFNFRANSVWATGTRAAEGMVVLDGCGQGSITQAWIQNASTTGYILSIKNACTHVQFDQLQLIGSGNSGTVAINLGTADNINLDFGSVDVQASATYTNDASRYLNSLLNTVKGPIWMYTRGDLGGSQSVRITEAVTGTSVYIRNLGGLGGLQFINNAFSLSLMELSDAGQLSVPVAGSSGGIMLGGDAQLYRSAASTITVAGHVTLQATRPTLLLEMSGQTRKVRFNHYVAGSAYLTANTYFDGTNWNLDDTGNAGAVYAFSGSGPLALYAVPASANPASLSLILAMTTGGQLQVPTTGSSAGILIGGDAQIYRSAADMLRTPDSLTVDTNLTVSGMTTGVKLNLTHKTTTNTTEADYAISIGNSNTVQLLLGVNEVVGYSIIQSFDPGTSWSTRGLVLQPNGGNVGVAVDPANKFHVYHNSAGYPMLISTGASSQPAIEFKDGAGTQNWWILGSGFVSATDGQFFLFDARQSLSRIVITTGGQIQFPATGSTGGIRIGGDVDLYRSAANELTILDKVVVSGNGIAQSSSVTTGAIINSFQGITLFQANASTLGSFFVRPSDDLNPTQEMFVLQNAAGSAYVMRVLKNGQLQTVSSVKSSSPTAGIGYDTGAGGTVTQGAGSGKATGVTLNTVCGTITMNNAALAAGAIVTFTLTNSAIAATDVVIINHTSGGTAGPYLVNAQVAAGSATINVRNTSASSLSEAIVLRFAVIKAVTA